MSHEAKKAAETLLDASASSAQKRTALKCCAEYLEESHILDLPMPQETLQALKRLAENPDAETAHKSRAQSLLRKYAK